MGTTARQLSGQGELLGQAESSHLLPAVLHEPQLVRQGGEGLEEEHPPHGTGDPGEGEIPGIWGHPWDFGVAEFLGFWGRIPGFWGREIAWILRKNTWNFGEGDPGHVGEILGILWRRVPGFLRDPWDFGEIPRIFGENPWDSEEGSQGFWGGESLGFGGRILGIFGRAIPRIWGREILGA